MGIKSDLFALDVRQVNVLRLAEIDLILISPAQTYSSAWRRTDHRLIENLIILVDLCSRRVEILFEVGNLVLASLQREVNI